VRYESRRIMLSFDKARESRAAEIDYITLTMFG
jgi:hypothetical protein